MSKKVLIASLIFGFCIVLGGCATGRGLMQDVGSGMKAFGGALQKSAKSDSGESQGDGGTSKIFVDK